MRPRTCLIFISVPIFVILLVLAFPAVKLIRIFSEHSGIAITQDEVAAAHSASVPHASPQLIPKIIHQIFHDWRNQPMPSDWEHLRQTCIDLNKDWEYMVRMPLAGSLMPCYSEEKTSLTIMLTRSVSCGQKKRLENSSILVTRGFSAHTMATHIQCSGSMHFAIF
jgi:hypothetical protein